MIKTFNLIVKLESDKHPFITTKKHFNISRVAVNRYLDHYDAAMSIVTERPDQHTGPTLLTNPLDQQC